MVTVYVWAFRGKTEAWGHASMAIGATYVSWWPSSPGQVPSGIHPNLYQSHPFRNRSFADDVAAEGQPPDQRVLLDGLNEAAMKDWWQGTGLVRDGQLVQGPLQSWDTLKRNCSTIVAHGLKAGGGDTYASWVKSWNVVWKPDDVLQYARSIEAGLRAARLATPKAFGGRGR